MKNKALLLCAILIASLTIEAGHDVKPEPSFWQRMKTTVSGWFKRKPQTRAEKIADLKKQINATNKKLDDLDRKEDELDRREDELKERRKKLKRELSDLQDQKPKKVAPNKTDSKKCPSKCSKPAIKKAPEVAKKPAAKVAPKKVVVKK